MMPALTQDRRRFPLRHRGGDVCPFGSKLGFVQLIAHGFRNLSPGRGHIGRQSRQKLRSADSHDDGAIHAPGIRIP
jgi:hypothetical protein